MSKKALLLLAAVLAFLSVSVFAESVMQKPLFVKGVGGYNIYRIPALLTTQKGTLLAFCEGREGGDSSDIDLLLRRSEDGGETWSRKQVVWDQGKNICGNPCPVQDRDTGIIWLLMTWNHRDDPEDEQIEGTAEYARRPYVCYSNDDGKTWSEPVDLSETCRDPDWGWYATGPGVAIQLRCGKYKGRLVVPANHSDLKYEGSYYNSHVVYSDDHGKTWKYSQPIGPGCNESQVVELADGTLMMNMRAYNPSGYRAIATSTDGGETWTKAWRHDQLPEPTCQASFLRYSTVEDGGKNRLLFSNPASMDDRINMTVRVSYDEGKTWPVSKRLYSGSSAYSCLTVLPDGDIGCLYEAGEDDAAIYFARFSLEWLEGGEE
jgi:sialidase-1